MPKIIIKTKTDDSIELYDGEDKLVGDVENLNQVADICMQIKEKNISGYKFKTKTTWIPIPENGDFKPNKVDDFFPNFQKAIDSI